MKLKYLKSIVRCLTLIIACIVVISCTSATKRGAPVIVNPGDAVPRNEPYTKGANPASYVVKGKKYYVKKTHHGYKERGIASWYGKQFHGRKTANAEKYDMYKMTAAHKSLPIPSYVKVTNLDNKKTVIVRVNDRGPFHSNRIIDLSYAAAKKLNMHNRGTARVEVEAISADGKTIQLAGNNAPASEATATKKSSPKRASTQVATAKKSKSTTNKKATAVAKNSQSKSSKPAQKKAVIRTAAR